MATTLNKFYREQLARIREQYFKHQLPEYMWHGIEDWIVGAQPPGDFLSGVIKDSLFQAAHHADGTNKHLLRYYAEFFYNAMPVGSYGSAKQFVKWQDKGGFLGIQNRS